MEEVSATIIQMYDKGWNPEDIAYELGLNENYVLRVLEEAGCL